MRELPFSFSGEDSRSTAQQSRSRTAIAQWAIFDPFRLGENPILEVAR
jgi:hypothetical protein